MDHVTVARLWRTWKFASGKTRETLSSTSLVCTQASVPSKNDTEHKRQNKRVANTVSTGRNEALPGQDETSQHDAQNHAGGFA